MGTNKISDLKEHEWWIVGFVAFLAFSLGIVGFYQYSIMNKQEKSFLDLLYLSWQLFSSQSGYQLGEIPWQLQSARWLAPAVVIYAAVKGLAAITKEQFSLLKLKGFRNHIVICGLGQKGLSLAKSLYSPNKKLVIIESNENNDELADWKEKKGVVVLIGEATDIVLLGKARIEYANELFAVTGNDQTNIEILIKAGNILSEKLIGKKLRCYIHIFSMHLRQLLYDHKIFNNYKDKISVQLFNLYETSARLLFNEFSPDKFIPVKHSDSKSVHILVIGFGWMGECFVTQAIRAGHFANEQKLIISIIDKDSERLKNRFLIKHDKIHEIATLNFKNYDIDTISKKEFENIQSELSPFAACYIFLGNNEVFNLSIAKQIRKLFGNNEVHIVVSMSQRTGISNIIDQNLLDKENIHLFDIINSTCNEDNIINRKLDEKAKVIHDKYLARINEKGSHKENNPSSVPWNELSELHKDSNRCVADHINIKLNALGYKASKINQAGVIENEFKFSQNECEILARMEHRRWCAERRLRGWIHGKEKDLDKKTHPDLVPFDKLDSKEKLKDLDLINDIPDVLKIVGECIVRTNK